MARLWQGVSPRVRSDLCDYTLTCRLPQFSGEAANQACYSGEVNLSCVLTEVEVMSPSDGDDNNNNNTDKWKIKQQPQKQTCEPEVVFSLQEEKHLQNRRILLGGAITSKI